MTPRVPNPLASLVGDETLLAVETCPVETLPALVIACAALQARAAARLASSPGTSLDADPRSSTLLTIREAAQRLGMSEDWLYRNARDLPFTRRFGRRLRFDESSLRRWIASRPR